MPATKPTMAAQIEEQAQKLLDKFLDQRGEGMIYSLEIPEKPESSTETDAIEAWKLIAKLNREAMLRYLQGSNLTSPEDLVIIQDILHAAMELERKVHRDDWLTGLNSE